MTIKTKRASRSVPAEPSDGKRLLIVLKPSSAWRQGIPYDMPHVQEYEEAFRKLMMERVLIGMAGGLVYSIITSILFF
jgi:hypothetical protein